MYSEEKNIRCVICLKFPFNQLENVTFGSV